MSLHTFNDFYSRDRQPFDDLDIAQFDSYSLWGEARNRIGAVIDLLVDEDGYFRYFVIDVSPWGVNKCLLLPIGLARFDEDQRRIYVDGLTREHVESLPDYRSISEVNDHYERQVQTVFRSLASRRASHHFLDQPFTTASGYFRGASSGYVPSVDRDYDRQPTFYGMSDRDNQGPLKRYEQQLLAVKQHRNAGV